MLRGKRRRQSTLPGTQDSRHLCSVKLTTAASDSGDRIKLIRPRSSIYLFFFNFYFFKNIAVCTLQGLLFKQESSTLVLAEREVCLSWDGATSWNLPRLKAQPAGGQLLCPPSSLASSCSPRAGRPCDPIKGRGLGCAENCQVEEGTQQGWFSALSSGVPWEEPKLCGGRDLGSKTAPLLPAA